jgi:hypothetical protein
MSTNGIRVTLSALLIGTLFVIPSAGADEPPITKEDLETAQHNMKQIAIAFHYHQAEFEALPSNIVAKDDAPLLSWRVAILPYIKENALYKQFKLDEPWDSKHNIELVAKMPKLYAPVRVKAKAGETFCQVFVGEKALFGPKKKPTIISVANADGASMTGMVFEAGEPVIWSKPADLPFDVKKPLPKLGGLFDGECHVALCDGSVRLLKKKPDEKELKNLIMPADGNVVDFTKLEK